MILAGGDIKAWAERIRQDKVVELSAMIKENEDFLRAYDPTRDEYMSKIRVEKLSNIVRLRRKLKYII
jgi:hypothetical protein